MTKYFFSLGNNSDLSQAELRSLFPEQTWINLGTVLIGEFSEKINPKGLINVLGGTIKIGEIIEDFSLANRKALIRAIKKHSIDLAKKNNKARFNFGFSFYSKNIPGDFFKLGLALKKELKELGFSSRMVSSREKALSSVIVEQNKLLPPEGVDFCLLADKKRVFLGQSLAVQPFKVLSKRDFGRPARDDHSGMLPPKLAQIMLNLVRGEDNISTKNILDPFCGSGTILSEAYLMGFKKIIGSDISAKAVSDSQENLNWTKKFFGRKERNWEVFLSDVLELKKFLKNSSIDYIVSEPYLGPSRGFRDFKSLAKDLNRLYTKAIAIFFDVLKPGGRVIMIWPQFKTKDTFFSLSPEIAGFKKRSISVYGRANQVVWREIVSLEK